MYFHKRMALTQKDIEHIASLARLELSEEEKTMFVSQLSSILDYVGQLAEVDTEGVQCQYHVEGLFNVMQKDEIIPCDEQTRHALLSAMPERAGDLLKVKNVFS